MFLKVVFQSSFLFHGFLYSNRIFMLIIDARFTRMRLNNLLNLSNREDNISTSDSMIKITQENTSCQRRIQLRTKKNYFGRCRAFLSILKKTTLAEFSCLIVDTEEYAERCVKRIIYGCNKLTRVIHFAIFLQCDYNVKSSNRNEEMIVLQL